MIKSMKFACIYVDELPRAQKFYETYLGFRKEQEFRAGEIFGQLGEVGCWIGSGYKRADTTEKSTRATMMLGVDSVGALKEKLERGGEKIVQLPLEMKEGVFWMQFADPCGNILEVLGGK